MLGHAAHEPREPVRAVTDQHADSESLPCQASLVGDADAVEHLDLVVVTRGTGGGRRSLDLREQLDVVRSERQAAATTPSEELESELPECLPDPARIMDRDIARLVVRALHEAD